jgi:LmbE family N-acetylglucosaminyl deacetylase
MACLKTAEDIKKLGTILGVWAHPDDDTYSMAGIMAAAVKNGQRVIIVTATRGEAGVQDEARWPAAQLGTIRSREMADALQILGVAHHYWLDYPDGNCKDVDQEEAASRVAELIQRYKPESILTFGPDGMTGHDDHKTVSGWADVAVQRAKSTAVIYHAINTHTQYKALIEADKQFNIFFNTNEPPVCDGSQCAIHFELDDSLYEKKLAALHAMPSQTEAMLIVFADRIQGSLEVEAFTHARRTKE